MKSLIIICCIIAAAYGETESSVLRDGPCPKMEFVTVDYYKFSGNWYGCKESSIGILGPVNCSLLTLQLNGSNSYSVTYSGISKETGERLSVTATATIEGQKMASASFNLNTTEPMIKNYNVLCTDYNTHAIVMRCETFGSQHKMWISLNARDSKTCLNYDHKLQHAFEKLGANVTMNTVDGINCRYD